MADLAQLSAKIKLAIGNFPTWDVQSRDRSTSDYEAPGPQPLVLTKTSEKDVKPDLIYVQDDEPSEESESDEELEGAPRMSRPTSATIDSPAIQPVALLLAQTVVVEEEPHPFEQSGETTEESTAETTSHEENLGEGEESKTGEPVLIIRPKPKKTRCLMPEIKEVEDLKETDSFLKKSEPVIVPVLPVSERSGPRSFEHGQATESEQKQCCACVVL